MKVKLHLKSMDTTSLYLFISFLKRAFKMIKSNNITINRLPTKKKKISILKSPHVNKKAFEQFELKLFQSTILINNTNLRFLRFLILNKPKHVNARVTIKN